MRLHPDRSGFSEGLFVCFDAEGDVARTGFLEVGDDNIVRFVDDWTHPVVSPDPAGP